MAVTVPRARLAMSQAYMQSRLTSIRSVKCESVHRIFTTAREASEVETAQFQPPSPRAISHRRPLTLQLQGCEASHAEACDQSLDQ